MSPPGAHAYSPDPDGSGDCAACPLPASHPVHATAAPAPPARPINRLSKDEGMYLAAASRAAEDFRLTFFLAMAEVATRQEYITTNDAWDLLESRGYRRSGTAQSVGTIGPSGQSIGLWKRTEQKDRNTSGNLHSTDDGVRVYRSLIVGWSLDSVRERVEDKVEALAAAAEKRRQRTPSPPVESMSCEACGTPRIANTEPTRRTMNPLNYASEEDLVAHMQRMEGIPVRVGRDEVNVNNATLGDALSDTVVSGTPLTARSALLATVAAGRRRERAAARAYASAEHAMEEAKVDFVAGTVMREEAEAALESLGLLTDVEKDIEDPLFAAGKPAPINDAQIL